MTPRVYKITDETSIVMRSEYNKLENQIEILQEALEKQRDEKLRAQSDRDALEKRLQENLEIAPSTSTSEDTHSENEDLEHITKYLESNNLFPTFDEVMQGVDNQQPFKETDPAILALIKIGLFKKGTQYYDDEYNYEFTDIGNRYQEYYRRNIL